MKTTLQTSTTHDAELVSRSRRNRKPSEIAPGVYWYSAGAIAGNVYFVQSGSSWVLIDTATAGRGARIREAAAALFGASRPAAVLLTHVHPDHSGSALELARAWDCPVYLHPGELDLAISRNLATVARYANALDRWIIVPLLRLFPRRWLETKIEQQSLKEVVRVFEPDAPPPGLSDWTSITTPGHSPGHTAFIRHADRVLVSGDALLTVDAGSLGGVLSWILRPNKPRVCGPPWYTNWDRAMATTSAAVLVRLQPKVLAPGHGLPLSGEAAAVLIAEAKGEKTGSS
jgi:glyoxylase-like metal-dependent hydrolase (beta-lactamase superfamily II)